MTNHNKENIENDDILEEMEEEIEEIENEEGDIDEDKLEEAQTGSNNEIDRLKDLLARANADFDNFKKRTDRDKGDMIFYLKLDIFKKILPRIDDLERIIENTPEKMRKGVLFEGVLGLEKSLKKDLKGMGVTFFKSIGEEPNPDKHDVMTKIPGEEENIICKEFERGYLLNDRVLRHAKVVVGAGK